MKKQPITFNATEETTIELQIDESIFGKKCKYNRGRPFKRRWIVGISQQAFHKRHLEIVESRDEVTLLKIIMFPKQLMLKLYWMAGPSTTS